MSSVRPTSPMPCLGSERQADVECILELAVLRYRLLSGVESVGVDTHSSKCIKLLNACLLKRKAEFEAIHIHLAPSNVSLKTDSWNINGWRMLYLTIFFENKQMKTSITQCIGVYVAADLLKDNATKQEVLRRCEQHGVAVVDALFSYNMPGDVDCAKCAEEVIVDKILSKLKIQSSPSRLIQNGVPSRTRGIMQRFKEMECILELAVLRYRLLAGVDAVCKESHASKCASLISQALYNRKSLFESRNIFLPTQNAVKLKCDSYNLSGWKMLYLTVSFENKQTKSAVKQFAGIYIAADMWFDNDTRQNVWQQCKDHDVVIIDSLFSYNMPPECELERPAEEAIVDAILKRFGYSPSVSKNGTPTL